VSYTHLGIVVALVFVGIPFVVRTVQPVLAKLESEYEEAAYVQGAGRFTTFRRVILPEITPALLSGFGLAFARGLGEYGSVIYISGNSARQKTQVVSYVIMQKLNYMDYDGAAAVALVTLVISFLVLTLVNIVQIRQSRRTNEL
jgi:sulfate transport system permease protein